MRIDPSRVYREFASRFSCDGWQVPWRSKEFSWRGAVGKLRLRADSCRECDHEVGFGDTICAFCGARDPVRLPGWVSMIIVGFAVVNVVSLAGRVFGATLGGV